MYFLIFIFVFILFCLAANYILHSIKFKILHETYWELIQIYEAIEKMDQYSDKIRGSGTNRLKDLIQTLRRNLYHSNF